MWCRRLAVGQGTQTCTLQASGRSAGGTLHSTMALAGACKGSSGTLIHVSYSAAYPSGAQDAKQWLPEVLAGANDGVCGSSQGTSACFVD